MIWETEVPVTKQDDTYLVAATGGEFTFSCVNYSTPWISIFVCPKELYRPTVENGFPVNPMIVSLDWFRAEMKGNQLKVTFYENQQTEERPMKVDVSAGDVFYSFYFRQSANK